MLKQVFAIAAMLTAGSVQAATSFDLVTSFGTVSPYSFGSGTGAGFTASPNFAADNCVSTPGLACYNNNANAYTFPAIGKNISSSDPLVFYTNVLSKDMLFMQSLPGATATVRFTAPTTTTYTFAGAFTRIDNSNGSGDGVSVGYSSAAGSGSILLGTTYLNTESLGGSLTLNVGDSVDFYVDALSNTNNDGTGFALVASFVPEPASWALMLGGFGLVGATLRRRTRVNVVYA